MSVKTVRPSRPRDWLRWLPPRRGRFGVVDSPDPPGPDGGCDAQAVGDPVGETQIYRGYSAADLTLFDRFSGIRQDIRPGFITDFLGVLTRASFHAGLAAPEGALMGLPVPTDSIHAEAIEWVGLLKSVVTAGRNFACMEVGAGWGPWIVAGGAAARHLGITDIHLTGVEADPGHFAFMLDHLRDNGFEPANHTTIHAAVGVEAGRAHWPKCADPSSDWGSRPVVGEVPDADHVGRTIAAWLDVEMRSFQDLLSERPVWDLVHIDVQGWEADLCRSAAELIDQRVRWMIVATHDPKLHGDVMQHMHASGWRLENEKPPRLNLYDGAKTLQAMVHVDGTQVWRNARVGVVG